MVDAAVAASPARSGESLEIGVYHNSLQKPDGTWAWRYDSLGGHSVREYQRLWDLFGGIPRRSGAPRAPAEEVIATPELATAWLP